MPEPIAGNTAPGQNRVLIGPSVTPVLIPSDEIKNGNLAFSIANTLTAPATVTGAEAGCPNPNWTGVNPVATVTAVTLEIEQPVAPATSTCTASNQPGLSGRVPATCVLSMTGGARNLRPSGPLTRGGGGPPLPANLMPHLPRAAGRRATLLSRAPLLLPRRPTCLSSPGSRADRARPSISLRERPAISRRSRGPAASRALDCGCCRPSPTCGRGSRLPSATPPLRRSGETAP